MTGGASKNPNRRPAHPFIPKSPPPGSISGINWLFAALFRVLAVMARFAKADEVLRVIYQLGILVRVLDVMYFRRRYHPSIARAYLAAVSIPTQNRRSEFFPFYGSIVEHPARPPASLSYTGSMDIVSYLPEKNAQLFPEKRKMPWRNPLTAVFISFSGFIPADPRAGCNAPRASGTRSTCFRRPWPARSPPRTGSPRSA